MTPLPLLTFLLLHPVHATLAEVEWNDQTGRLEVALRMDVLDEQWVEKNVADRFGGERSRMHWRLRYLQTRFRITALPEKDQPDKTSYRWIGRQIEGSHVWWFFEIEPPTKMPPEWIEVRLLREREENYTHRVVILGEDKPRSVTLTHARPKASLTADADGTRPAYTPTAEPQ